MKLFLKYPRRFSILFLTAAAVALWYSVATFSSSGLLKVAFLDIGQGDAIFVETPRGNQILIDGGPGNKVLQRLSERMSFFDRTIDMVVATHPDADHISGLLDVFKRYDVGLVVESGGVSDSALYKNLEKAIEREVKESGARRLVARRGMDFTLDQDVHLLILFPDRDVSKIETNEGSIVAKLVYKNTSVMLTGDSPTKIEEYLVSLERSSYATSNLKSDILKVGHHGSKTSTGEMFLDAVAPRFAIISAGKNNRYKHPNEEVLDRLSKTTTTVLSTISEGTILFESDGGEWNRK